jgi:hypothetical protein
MNKLSGGERNLLRYYAETERILHGAERGAAHQHLLLTAVAARQFELVSDLRRAIELLERSERERAFTPLARRTPS